jgi:hypothetical protein
MPPKFFDMIGFYLCTNCAKLVSLRIPINDQPTLFPNENVRRPEPSLDRCTTHWPRQRVFHEDSQQHYDINSGTLG